MGWLRDLMQQAPTPMRSLGDLSRSALRSGDWPHDTKMQARSLAALFSKLDRGQELDWLGDRPGAQVALAKALGASLDDIRARVRRRQDEAPGQVLRLRTLPAARALALLEEPLFPGIPPEVLEPASFGGVFWIAASGAGRTLVGRWLEARGLARYVHAETWAEARTKLPAHGAVFVELEAPSEMPSDVPAGLRCCIAAPPAAAAPATELDASWPGRVVRTPPPETYLRDLLTWVSQRLPQDDRFDPARVLAWLQGEPLERGVIDGPGAVLGLCGLADELGMRALAEPLDQLVRRYAQARFTQALDPEAAHTAFFRKNGYGALVALVRRLLTESGPAWDAPRPREQWLSLVPEELQREADLDWLKLTLGTGAGALRTADLERAAKKLPPGAFRVIRSLEQAGLLEATSGDRLKLGPRFVARALLTEAVAALANSSPIEWGTALLEGSASQELEGYVLERARESAGQSLEPLLEVSDPDSLPYVGAFELGFVAAGLALLEGAELARDLRENLFEDQLELMLELPGELPVPRVLRGGPAERAQRHGLFLLSALALSEDLPAAARKHPLLRPWQRQELDPRTGALLDCVAAALESPLLGQAGALAAFALVGRLRASVGALVGIDTPHALERPAVIVEEVMHGVLTWPTVAGLGRGRGTLLGATRAAALTLDVPWSDVARATWLAWDAAERPAEGADFLLPENDAEGAFWAHIPRELLRPLLADARDKPMPFERLREEPWAAIEEAVLDGALSPTPELVRHAPLNVLDSWLMRRGLEPFVDGSLSVLFERLPERLLRVLSLHFEKPSPHEAGDVVALLAALPDSLLAEAVATTEDKALVRLPGPTLTAIRKLLHRAVSSGGGVARQAYPVLADLEQKLSAARRA
ncbi:MAG TPA: hypothetical protein VHB79_32050 [Polyangiaceae bacterium]|nr:hypothetical protein [Polyangiaceae bacterium]